jgi:predicted small metal-binding protein
MKSFACGDVVPGCHARWVCSTEEEILFAVAQHARDSHGMSEVPAAVVSAVRAAIVPVAA